MSTPVYEIPDAAVPLHKAMTLLTQAQVHIQSAQHELPQFQQHFDALERDMLALVADLVVELRTVYRPIREKNQARVK